MTSPVDVEVLSWSNNPANVENFQSFLSGNDVDGVLGIGPNGRANRKPV